MNYVCPKNQEDLINDVEFLGSIEHLNDINAIKFE